MAEKGKYIKAKMWEDEWFMSLNNQERLVFLYLLTSRARVMSGIITASLSSMADAINSKQAKEKYKEINRYIMKHNKRPDNIPEGFVYYDEDYVEEVLKNFEDKEKIIILKDNKLLMVNYYKNQDFDNQSMLQGVLKDIIDLVKSYGSFFTDKLANNKSFYNSLIIKIEVMLRDKALPREKMIDQDKRLVEEMVNLIRLVPIMFKETAILKLCLRYLSKNKLTSNEDINELINLTNNTQSIHPVHTLPTPSGECPHNRIELNQTKTNQIKPNEIKPNNSLGLSSSLGLNSRGMGKNIESNKNTSLGDRVFKDSQDTPQELENGKGKSKSPKVGEEEDKRQLTAITKYHRYTTKGFYYDFDDIKENEIEMISPIMDKCNEYLLDKMTDSNQIDAYSPITYKTGYKILSEFFEGDKELFESILKARIDQWSEYENKDSYRNFDILLYCLMTGVTVKQMTSEEWK